MYSTLKRAAYHEAGHAVVAIKLHRRFTHVTIEPDKAANSLGHVLFTEVAGHFQPATDSPARVRHVIERDVLISAAGNAGAALLTRRQAHWGIHGDVHGSISLLDHLTASSEESNAYLNWLWVKAHNLIMKPVNQAAVKALAAELLKLRTIRYVQARIIIRIAQESFISRGLAQQAPVRFIHADGSTTLLSATEGFAK
jgi:hypothetical protein